MSNIIEPDTKFTPTIETKLEPQIDWAHASVILGRGRQAVKELGLEGTMNLGVICEHQNTGASLFGYKVLFDNQFPHIIFVCGKRGSGKSYTLGVVVEELARSNTGIGTVVIDPLGTFWTMDRKNDSKKAAQILANYGLFPKDFNNIQVLAPIGFYEDMKASVDGAFSVSVSDLSVDDWCLVFGIDRFKTQGLLIGDVLDKINNGYDAKLGDITKKIPPKNRNYTIGDIIFCTQYDVGINSAHEGYALSTRRSVIARFRSAAKWGIFSVNGTPINQISIKNKITILDVSHSKLGSSRRALIVGILARKILEARIESSRQEEVSSMGLSVSSEELIPVTWLIVDEAHLLLPASGKTPATESLIEYAKLGRKPGCGLVFATQRPAATNDEILSQVDTIIGHNLALEDDIAALRRRIPAKMPEAFSSSDFIRGIPVGVCLLADQKTQQRTMLVQIRPRMTHHSGKAAIPKAEQLAVEPKDSVSLEGEPEELAFEAELKPELESELDLKAEVPLDLMKPTVDVSEFMIKDDIKEKGKLEKDLMDIDELTERQEILNEIEELRKNEKVLSSKPVRKEDKSGDKVEVESKSISTSYDSEIDKGGAYLILTKGTDFALNIFHTLTKNDAKKSMSITRTHPKKLSGNVINGGVNTYWLSKTPEKNSVPPGNITKLSYIISEHLKTNDESVIFLDGLEYLISNNDFSKILKFVETLHEKIVLNNGVLLVTINPSTMLDKDFELLENELVNTIKDPTLGGVTKGLGIAQAVTEKVDLDDKLKATAEEIARDFDLADKSLSSQARTRAPSKEDLKRMCSKLGLPTTGSESELKKRLLDYESGPTPEPKAPKKEKSEVPAKEKQEKPKKEKAEEESMIPALEKERQALIAERKELKAELKKLKEQIMKRKVESEKQKLNRAKKLLEERQKKLENQLQQLPPKSDQIKPQTKAQDLERPSHIPSESKPIQLPKKQSLEFEVPIGRKVSKQMIPKKRTTTKVPEGKKSLVVQARLKGNSIKEFAIKQLKKSLFGKPLEAIKSIRPVYLPLLKVHVKTMRGSIFTKEQSGAFYWDTVTGEIITDVNNLLKRSKGISTLMDLTPNQARVLAAVSSTWPSKDLVDIQQDLDLSVTQIKRTLTELDKKSLVTKELQPEKNIYNYKRMVELKYPKKLEKVKVEMPGIILGPVNDYVLPARFKLTDLEKLIKSMAPGTRIIHQEELYYPYFEVDIVGKSGPRVILLDALSGVDDKILTELMQFQQ